MRSKARAALDLESIPLVDAHCHPISHQHPKDALDFRRFFTESPEPQMSVHHVPHTLFYLEVLRDLSALLECPPEEGRVLEERSARGVTEWLQAVVRSSGLRTLLVDTGYLKEGMTVAQMGEALAPVGCKVREVLRLEVMAEELIPRCETWAAFLDRFVGTLKQAPKQGIVAYKTVIAYRSGLDVGRPSEAEAKAGFPRLREEALRTGRLRVTDKPFLDFLLWRALELAAAQGMPVQVHTGFGNPNEDLFKSNPLLLRPILIEPALRTAPLMLLHCYPYHQEAAYLTAVYTHVFMELSMSFQAAGPAAPGMVEETLRLAPASKLLYASDAWGIPDLLWVGATSWRRAMTEVLGQWVGEKALSIAQAEDMARRIFHGNAVALYKLEDAPMA